MMPLATTANSLLPTSMAAVPESRESGPMSMKPTAPSSAAKSQMELGPNCQRQRVQASMPTLIMKITGVRLLPNSRSEATPAKITPMNPTQSKVVEICPAVGPLSWNCSARIMGPQLSRA